MKELVLVVVLLAVARGLEFGLTIDPYETQCFYEQLGATSHYSSAAQAKYNVEVVPDDRSRYEFSIRTTGESARDIFVKETSGDMEPVPRKPMLGATEQIRSRTELLLFLHTQPAGRAAPHIV